MEEEEEEERQLLVGLTRVRGGAGRAAPTLLCPLSRNNGTRGPLDLEGGRGHLDTDCCWTEVTGGRKSDNWQSRGGNTTLLITAIYHSCKKRGKGRKTVQALKKGQRKPRT